MSFKNRAMEAACRDDASFIRAFLIVGESSVLKVSNISF